MLTIFLSGQERTRKMLLHGITVFLCLVSSIHAADHPRSLQSPKNCFNGGLTGSSFCGTTVKYPSEEELYDSCGYPGLSLECNPASYGERAFINIANHIYRVIDIDYKKKRVRLVDMEVDKQECPQPTTNFSLPPSLSWVKYYLTQSQNLTIFSNCTSVPVDAQHHIVCSEDHYKNSNTPPSYAFYQGEVPEGSDWYRNCTENVLVPVNSKFGRYPNYTYGITYGFHIGWSAIDWCHDCEHSGGQCWSNSTTTGCACRDNNSYNRMCPPLSQGMSTRWKIVIGVSAGIGGLLLVALFLFCGGVNHSSYNMLHWRNKNRSLINVEVFLERYRGLALQRYTYSGIKKMTNSFKDVLGQGGYGQVFKGQLHDGRLVAVKVLNESKGDGEDFINEVATIGRTNHVNVVNLLGFCIEGTRRALVYEFMPNGSLERFIYTQKESSATPSLSWQKLYQISLDIARGLQYLHRGCNTRILHFDIKPHNILLDENFCPKISDFGLAKLCPTRESMVSTIGARGTMGYIAPELYCRTFGNVSHKSDVYSYGMMMLEMIGGRKNIDVTVDNISEIYFPLWIYNCLKQNADGLEEMQAREVLEDENIKRMIIIALWCIQPHPMDRPSMSKVVEMLEGNPPQLEFPPNPSIPRSSSSTSS